MTTPRREIYLLSPKLLSPETIAVAFAKTSRAPESFREIAAELNDEKSARFHEKWVLGYGHASVAEHAVLHLAIENASRLAMEAIESNRLASYTEKSTRYQKWDADNFYIPAELDGHPLREEYIATCRLLFETYAASLEPVRALVQKTAPRREAETDEAWDRRIRSQYVDVCRFLLPAASLANVGMTANGRVLESAIRKWSSSPLAEVRDLGETVRSVAKAEIPTLLKYADPLPYLLETSAELSLLARQADQSSAITDWCQLVDYDREAEQRVLAAALYRFGGMSYRRALELVESAPERASLADALLKHLGRFDIPLRELEHSNYTFDLVMDQGAYAEFKRHRMMSQTPQRLTCALGYALPRRFVEAGFEAEYRRAMDAATSLWEKLAAWNPDVAQYLVPNGCNRRVLVSFNLREAYSFCQLRASTNAHFSIRRVAQRVAQEISRVHPLLAGAMRLPDESWQGIEAEYFTGTK
ncbi:MAG TPA: FAD-dependent thymidylate synthase [Anaerolineales bacterium]|jgi:thymidylate synthase ThyX